MKKIGSFISTIVTIVLAIVVGCICYKLNISTLAAEGAERLSLVITLPLAIVLYVLLFGLSISSIATSISALRSESKTILITSIVLLVIALAELGCAIYMLTRYIKAI